MDNNNLTNSSWEENNKNLEQVSIWWPSDNNLFQGKQKVKIDVIKLIKGLLLILILAGISFAGYKYYTEKNNLSVIEDESSYTSNVKPRRETNSKDKVDAFKEDSNSGTENKTDSWTTSLEKEISNSNSWMVASNSWMVTSNSWMTTSNSWMLTSNSWISTEVNTWNINQVQSGIATDTTGDVNELDWFLQNLNNDNSQPVENPNQPTASWWEDTLSELDEYLKSQ